MLKNTTNRESRKTYSIKRHIHREIMYSKPKEKLPVRIFLVFLSHHVKCKCCINTRRVGANFQPAGKTLDIISFKDYY
jgi:hypothetical protein